VTFSSPRNTSKTYHHGASVKENHKGTPDHATTIHQIQSDILQELAECSSSPPEGIKVQLVDESSLYKWEVSIDGPSQSVYSVRPTLSPIYNTHTHL